MRSVRTRAFKQLYASLSRDLQGKADKAFRLWVSDTNHPGLNFEKVIREDDV